MAELQPLWFVSASRHCVVCVETPESLTQVYMSNEGVLEVHGNVVFEAKTAGDDGGAMSLQLVTVLLFFCGILRQVLRKLV